MRILHYIAYQISILRNGTENLKTISMIWYEHCVNNTGCSNVRICGKWYGCARYRACPWLYLRKNTIKKSILIILPSFLISHMGGGGMVDRYMDWYVRYVVVYMPVLRCCILWCVRQSNCRGPTVRLIVFALDLCIPNHKTRVGVFVAQTILKPIIDIEFQSVFFIFVCRHIGISCCVCIV